MRKRVLLGAVVVVGIVAGLTFTSFGGAAVGRVSQLIAPTANSAVADINAFNNWGLNGCGSTCSRAGFKQTTHFDTGIYCLTSPTAVPDKSMLLVTIDNQHSNTPGIGSIMWDRSSPNCGSSSYEVYTYCNGGGIEQPPPPDAATRGQPNPAAPVPGPKQPHPAAPAGAPRAPDPGTLCDDIAFYAEAYVR